MRNKVEIISCNSKKKAAGITYELTNIRTHIMRHTHNYKKQSKLQDKIQEKDKSNTYEKVVLMEYKYIL